MHAKLSTYDRSVYGPKPWAAPSDRARMPVVLHQASSRIANARDCAYSLDSPPANDAQLCGAAEISAELADGTFAMPDPRNGLDWFSKDLLGALPAAVYVCDPSGAIVAYNARATELWGRTPAPGQTDERFCGSHKLFRMDGTYMPHHETPMEHVLRTGEHARDLEAVIERPDGSRISVLVNIAPLSRRLAKLWPDLAATLTA